MDGKISVILNEIKDKLSEDYCVIILSSSEPRCKKLKELLIEYGIESTLCNDINNICNGKVFISLGYLNEGYDFFRF